MGTFKTQLLWDSIRKGDLSATVSLLENGTINPEERDDKGQTFLMLSSECGELEIVREMLEFVDVNAVDNENWSALMCAAKAGHLEIVIELLEKGAELDHRDMVAFSDITFRRKSALKPTLQPDFQSLCSTDTVTTDWLFGDRLDDQIKELSDAQRIRKKILKSSTSKPRMHPYSSVNKGKPFGQPRQHQQFPASSRDFPQGGSWGRTAYHTASRAPRHTDNPKTNRAPFLGLNRKNGKKD